MNTGRIQQDAVRSTWAAVWMVIALTALTAGVIWLCLPADAPALAEVSARYPLALPGDFRPEARERGTFLGTLALLPLLVAAVFVGSRRFPKLTKWCGAAAAWSVWIFVAVWGVGSFPLWDFLADGHGIWMAVAALAGGIGVMKLLDGRYGNAALNCWFPIWAGLVWVGVTWTFRIYWGTEAADQLGPHINILMQAAVEAHGGCWTVSQYGFWAVMLIPLWAVLGCSALTFSLVFAGLGGVVLALTAGIVWRTVRLKLLAWIGVLILALLCNLIRFVHQTEIDPYFQYFPLRLLFPSIGCFLVWHWSEIHGNWRFFGWGVLLGAGIFWNFDSGIPTVIALVCWLVWRNLCRRNLPEFRAAGFWFAGMAVAALGIAGVLWYVIGGGMSALWRFQNLFYMEGFYLLPMPYPWHGWGGVVLIYIASFVVGIWENWRRAPGRTADLFFYGGIIGLGLFGYYQGRSHDFNLIMVSYWAYWLVLLWVDRWWRLATVFGSSGRIVRLSTIGAVILLTGTALCCLQPSVWGRRIAWQWAQMTAPAETAACQVAFLQKHAVNGSGNIFGWNQGVLAGESGIVPEMPCNLAECFSLDDFRDLLRRLAMARRPLFVVKRIYVDEWFIPEKFLRDHYRFCAESPDGMIRCYLPINNMGE